MSVGQRAALLVGAVAVVGGVLWMAVPVTVDRGSGFGQAGRFIACDGGSRFLVAAECAVREGERDGLGRLAMIVGAVVVVGGFFAFSSTAGARTTDAEASTSSPPSGWYDDPSVPGRERWWDGSRWTEHFRAPGEGSAG